MTNLDINLIGNLARISEQVQDNDLDPDSVGTFDPFSQSSNSLFDGGFHGQSFFSTETNTLVVAFSGTNLPSPDDLSANLGLAAGVAEAIGITVTVYQIPELSHAPWMARLACIVVPGLPHHVAQRGDKNWGYLGIWSP